MQDARKEWGEHSCFTKEMVGILKDEDLKSTDARGRGKVLERRQELENRCDYLGHILKAQPTRSCLYCVI